ncbi:MAG TPA: nucleotidyltransferase domain-containing protein [bacterium]|jgi:predicted nucleotidyltransferase
MLRRAAFEAEIKRISEQLIRLYKPEKIILFGSLAAGEIHEGSDIDLFIIKQDVPDLGVNRIRQLDSLIKYKLATDFLVYRPDEVESSLKMGDPFVEYVLQQGRILYSAN